MAKASTTPEVRACEVCGAQFSLNKNYSAAQKARAKFCSRRCSVRGRPRKAPSPIDRPLQGQTRFGSLTFIGEGEPLKTHAHPIRRARFRCDCGNICDMQPTKVACEGGHRSCGCVGAQMTSKRMTKHGGYLTPEYKSWNAMNQRCHNERSTSFAQYGGRGISVCTQWRGDSGFLRFVEDMGPRPEGFSIDRIDPNGNYEPANCRWASQEVQDNNKRHSALITVGGETLSQAQWARRSGLSKNTVAERIKDGWPPELAATLPRGSRKP